MCTRPHTTRTDIRFLGGLHRTRPSWDPLTALVAVRNASAAHLAPCTHCEGANSVNRSSGYTEWRPGTATNQTYLTLRKGRDGQRVADQIDALLCRTPRRRKPSRK